MQREFGEFLDLVKTTELDSKVCNIVIGMIEEMSKPYQNTEADRGRGGEKERARIFRKLLFQLIGHLLGPNVVPTIEPSSVRLVSCPFCLFYVICVVLRMLLMHNHAHIISNRFLQIC